MFSLITRILLANNLIPSRVSLPLLWKKNPTWVRHFAACRYKEGYSKDMSKTDRIVIVWRFWLWNQFHTLANGVLALASWSPSEKILGIKLMNKTRLKTESWGGLFPVFVTEIHDVRLCLWPRTKVLRRHFSEVMGA